MNDPRSNPLDFKRQFRAWAMFDFANSLIYTNIVLYFPQWYTIRLGVNDFWYNALLTLSTFLLILTAPSLGMRSDQTGKRVGILRVTAVPMILGTASLPLITRAIPSLPIAVLIISLLFLVVNYSYQISLLFYDALLGDVATEDRYLNASGVGFAVGWIGALVGILAVLPFVRGSAAVMGFHGSEAAFIAGSILFCIVGGPCLFLLREPRQTQDKALTEFQTKPHSLRRLWTEVRNLRNQPRVFWFLIAYWFFIDAILTVQENLSIYLERVIGFDDSHKALLALAGIIASVLGAFATAVFVKRKFAERSLRIVLATGSLCLVGTGLAPRAYIAVTVLLIAAFLFGSIWTLARAIYTEMTPPGQRCEYFGFYSIAEKSSSVVGPILWGSTVSLLSGFGVIKYKTAMFLMAALMLLGMAILSKASSATRQTE